jgi:hypothetical protein
VSEVEKFVENAGFENPFEEIDCLATGLTNSVVHAKLNSIPLCPAHKLRSTPLTPELMAAILTRRDLRRIYQRTGDRVDKSNWNKASGLVRSLSKKADVDNLRNECTSMNNLIYRGPRIFWRKIKNVMSNCNVSSAVASFPFNDANGAPILDNSIIANMLADQADKAFSVPTGPEFDSVFRSGLQNLLKRRAEILSPSQDRFRSVHPMCILSCQDVEMCVNNIFNKAPGHDAISNALLRHCPSSYIQCLTRLFNLILKHGYIPKTWKFAHIVMIPKQGKDLSLVSSYRPISLLPSQPKVLERIMALRFLCKMQELDIIPNFQCAFQNRKATNDHLFRVGQHVSIAKKQGKETVIVCLDNQGAFDCSWPDAIRFQLLNTDIPADFIRYVSNFLDFRSFSVRVRDVFSSVRFARAGVPQGSSLSPHLYILLVRNIFKKNCDIWLEVDIGHFADDIALWTSDKLRSKAVARMNRALEEVSEWMSKYRQVLNTSKSQAMIFTTKGLPKAGSTPLFIRGTVLQWREFVLYLGIRFDRTLSWRPQYEHMIEQFDSRVNVLRKLCFSDFGLDPKVALIVYKGYIRPVIEYGCPAFLALQKFQIDKLQTLQNKALRLCLRAPQWTPISELHKSARIPLLHDHLISRTTDFIRKALDYESLCGEEARFYLDLFSSDELAKTPLGFVKDLLSIQQ